MMTKIKFWAAIIFLTFTSGSLFGYFLEGLTRPIAKEQPKQEEAIAQPSPPPQRLHPKTKLADRKALEQELQKLNCDIGNISTQNMTEQQLKQALEACQKS